jgi:radical SAM protein with 4Fe4S-binding SPASM domain
MDRFVRTVATVIVKPTKFCNAQCTYCAAPPEVNDAPKWSFETFRRHFDGFEPALLPRANLLFHGGEPMLMGPEFYRQAHGYAKSVHPGIEMSIQTNVLLYESRRWRGVFDEVFGGRISTSFDPDERNRLYKGSAALYTRLFMDRLDAMADDGFRPMVIGTYTDDTVAAADGMYEFALARGDRAPSLRFNYRFPAGREEGRGELISPEAYGAMLLGLYERWMRDVPNFGVTPLDQMFRKVVGRESARCPWVKSCGGSFLAVEPNGDVYNCSEFADLQDEEYRFGNLDEHDVAALLASPAARAIRRRRVDLPQSCRECRHFDDCEGGCARDSVLYGRGLGGKFHYCASWMAVFDRIKESVATGEADGLLQAHGFDRAEARRMAERFRGYRATEAAS